MNIIPPIRKAVIPAAGLGTHFLPATKGQPKEMLPIVDKPAIQYIIEEAIQSGIEEILIITGRNKCTIEDYFDRSIELELALKDQGNYELLGQIQDLSKVKIHYIRQREANGLGNALLCAKQFIGNEPFAVLLGDNIIDDQVPCLKQLMEIHKKYGGTVLGVQEVAYDKVSSYVIVQSLAKADNLWQVMELLEKPKIGEVSSRLAVLGRYIIEPEIFQLLEDIGSGHEGEIEFTHALCRLAMERPMYAAGFAGRRYDIGDKQGYLEATVEFALKRPDLREEFYTYLLEMIGPILLGEISASTSSMSIAMRGTRKK